MTLTNAGTCVDCDKEVLLTENGTCSICGSASTLKRGAIKELELLIEKKEEEVEKLTPDAILRTVYDEAITVASMTDDARATKDIRQRTFHVKAALSQLSYTSDKLRTLLKELMEAKETVDAEQKEGKEGMETAGESGQVLEKERDS